MTSLPPSDVRMYLRTDWGVNGFKEVPTSNTIFYRPILLCCGGTLCNHAKPDKANGFAKKAEAMLNIIDVNAALKPVTIATLTYDDAYLIGENLRAFNSGQMPPDMFEGWVNTQLVPLFMTSEGKVRPVDEVKSNFRNIQVLAHSFGAIFMQQVGNLLVDKLHKAGYSESEIDDITRQVVVVTAGSVADMHKGKAKFTTLNILHGRDNVAQNYSSNIAVARALTGLRDQENDPLAAMPFQYQPEDRSFDIVKNPRQILLVGNPSELDDPTALRLNDSKNGYSRIPHDGSIELMESTDTTFHESETYFDFSFTNNGMMLRLAASNVLNAAINNSLKNYLKDLSDDFTPVPSIDKMLEAKSVKTQMKDGEPELISERAETNEFGFDNSKDYSFVANMVGYNERMKNALEAVHAPPRVIE